MTSYIVGVVYRPPGTDIACFLFKMGEILEKVKNKRLYLMGDYNIDLIKSNQHIATDNFLSSMNSAGLHPLISLPTRVTSTSATLIDNIFTNNFCSDVTSGLIVSSISDHFPIFAFLGEAAAIPKDDRQFSLRRVVNRENKERFKKWVYNWGRGFALGGESVAEDAARFRNEFRDGYNECFPQKRVRLRGIDIRKPWLCDEDFLGKVKEKNRLYAAQFKHPGGLGEAEQARLALLTKEVNHLRRDLKRCFFARKLSESGKNSRAAWRVLHDFIGKPGRKSSSADLFVKDGAPVPPSDVPGSFCSFFSEIGPKLASACRKPVGGSFRDYLGPPSLPSAVFFPTSPEEIESLCQGLDGSKGPGHDDISPSVLKFISREIGTPLSVLINGCLEAGHFPEFLKVARVTPVFKAGDPTMFGNYRPISVLSAFSKIFERIIQKRILGFFKKQGSIYCAQYGFRRGHSTYMAVLDMVENIRKAWENGEHCLGIFIDFKKAFDTVDHQILLGKMEHLGIRGVPLELIRSYLTNRKQYVVHNGMESSQQGISVGVPQGSILGPLFFLIYINDLSRVSLFLRCILFADDTNVFVSHKDKRELFRLLGVELGKLSDWFAHNKLTLNYDKTEFINFSKPDVGSQLTNTGLVIDGIPIREVNESKFLGVHIDKNVSWRVHIGKIRTKISQTVGIIGRARRFMDGPQLLDLYNTMVLPHLQYCLINWGNFKGDRNLGLRDGLLSLQKTFVRIITGSHRISHADPLFAKLGVLKIDDLYSQRVRIFSYQLSKGHLPGGIASLFDRVGHSYGTRGAGSNIYVSRSPGSSIVSIAPKYWNILPRNLKESPSLASFKESSKRGFLLGYSEFICRIPGCSSCVFAGGS